MKKPVKTSKSAGRSAAKDSTLTYNPLGLIILGTLSYMAIRQIQEVDYEYGSRRDARLLLLIIFAACMVILLALKLA